MLLLGASYASIETQRSNGRADMFLQFKNFHRHTTAGLPHESGRRARGDLIVLNIRGQTERALLERRRRKKRGTSRRTTMRVSSPARCDNFDNSCPPFVPAVEFTLRLSANCVFNGRLPSISDFLLRCAILHQDSGTRQRCTFIRSIVPSRLSILFLPPPLRIRPLSLLYFVRCITT